MRRGEGGITRHGGVVHHLKNKEHHTPRTPRTTPHNRAAEYRRDDRTDIAIAFSPLPSLLPSYLFMSCRCLAERRLLWTSGVVSWNPGNGGRPSILRTAFIRFRTCGRGGEEGEEGERGRGGKEEARRGERVYNFRSETFANVFCAHLKKQMLSIRRID